MNKPPLKRRSTGRRLVCELLESRTLLSTTPDGSIAVQLVSQADVTALNQLAASVGASTEATSIPGLVEVQGTSSDLAKVSAAASSDPSVQYVEPVQTEQATVVPNDPEFTNGDLWGMNGTYGINAPAAWNVTTGSPATVTVADIDTGIDYDHPDLYQNVWINQPEIPTSRMKNLVDVYHDGYISWRDLNNPINIGPGKITDVNGDGVIDAGDILSPMILNAQGQDTGTGGWANPNNTQDGDTAHPDDLIGWNFVNNTNNPLDDNGHGTHTAGTIGAMGNNGIGVVGVNWNTQIMALKFLDNTGSGSDTAAAEAIDYAALHGAKVINASWGSTGVSSALQNAISLANTDGVVFVAADGNSSLNTDTSPFYPADYNIPNVISVGALASDGTRAGFSNYGPKSVDLFAPGENIESTYTNNQYAYDSGTSMAAPHVTGTVALVEGLHPTWTVSQLVNQILSTTTPDPSLQGLAVTGGILNAGAAVATPPSSSASYVGTDTTTQGLWRSAYGADGYDIQGDTSGTNPSLPSYATVSLTGASTYTWGTNTGNSSALQNVANTGDIASTWYSLTNFDIHININDGKAHLVTFYALDWNNVLGNDPYPARSQRFDVLDAGTGSVLATQSISSFDGDYVSFLISGNVDVRVTNLNPQGGASTADVSAIFFGAGVPATATATAAGIDTKTQGYWRSAYGADGYDLQGDTSGTNPSLPSYATVSLSGASTYTWGTNTGNSSALQNVASTGDIASTWYSLTNFDIHININDGKAHLVTFYALDWNNVLGNDPYPARSQRFDVLDAGTGSVLATQSISSFDGDYVSFLISGNVDVRVTNLNPQGPDSTADVSAIFFGAGAPTTASASYVGTDTTTQGLWRSAYGADGYDIQGDTSGINPSLPSYASVSLSGASTYTWGTNTGNSYALQNVANTGDIASTLYALTGFDIHINISDGKAHLVTFYALDWNNVLGNDPYPARSQRFDVLDASTGAVLASQTISSFDGDYVSFLVSGNVDVRLTNLNPQGPDSTADVSAIFFGAAGS